MAPGKFCVYARVLDWFPRDVDQFCLSDQLLFSLHIGDDTATSDVLLTGEHAESFLGCSTIDFISSKKRRHDIARKLDALVKNEQLTDFYLFSYLSSTKDEASGIATRHRALATNTRFDSQIFILHVILVSSLQESEEISSVSDELFNR